MKDKHYKRHTELAIIFAKMGKALADEGYKNLDTDTQMLGNILLFVSIACKDKKELKQLGDFANLMASKRLIEGVRSNSIDDKGVLNMDEFQLLKMDNEELLGVIKTLRKKLGLDNNDSPH